MEKKVSKAAILISDKVYFKKKIVTKDKEGNCLQNKRIQHL